MFSLNKDKDARNDDSRFWNFVLLNQKWKQQNCKCSQNFDLNPSCESVYVIDINMILHTVFTTFVKTSEYQVWSGWFCNLIGNKSVVTAEGVFQGSKSGDLWKVLRLSIQTNCLLYLLSIEEKCQWSERICVHFWGLWTIDVCYERRNFIYNPLHIDNNSILCKAYDSRLDDRSV